MKEAQKEYQDLLDHLKVELKKNGLELTPQNLKALGQ